MASGRHDSPVPARHCERRPRRQRPDGRRYLADNPFLKFNNAQRGYVVCDVTPERWQTEFKVLDKVSERGGTLTTRATFAVASGDARILPA